MQRRPDGDVPKGQGVPRANVRVVSVNTLNRQGKVKRRRFTQGKRADQKRAIVKLAEGDTIEIFETGK